jgi:hypothetical protein
MKNDFKTVVNAGSFVFQHFQNGKRVFTFDFYNGETLTGIMWVQKGDLDKKKMYVTLKNPANIEQTASFDMEDVALIQAVA